VKVAGARIWWNVDRKLDPILMVHCNDKKVRAAQLKSDEGGRSGTLGRPDAGDFEWSPFDPVKVEVQDDRTIKNAVLQKVCYSGFGALTGLLGEQPLDRLSDADPARSRVQILCEFEYDGHPVSPRGFGEHFEAVLPRVIPVVPAKLAPESLALDFWLLHHPTCYYRSAAIYEDLYRSRREPDKNLERLGRAMVAYFRSFAFAESARLAREIPDDEKITAGMRLHLSGWLGVPDLRRLGEVATRAAALDREGETFRCLARFMLHWQASLRLSYIANDQEQRKDARLSDLQRWRASLVEEVGKDRQAAHRLADPLIRSFIHAKAGKAESDLKALESLLR
jgi:hypothetical protein